MSILTRERMFKAAVLGIFLLLILWQSYILLDKTILHEVERASQILGKDRLYRSAFYEGGDEFGSFVMFLNDVIPSTPDVRVVLPPHRLGSRYTFESYMQYFLYPRTIDNCHDPLDECVLNHTSNRAYILSVPKFPPADVTSIFKDFVPFRPPLGIYIPKPGETDVEQGTP